MRRPPLKETMKLCSLLTKFPEEFIKSESIAERMLLSASAGDGITMTADELESVLMYLVHGLELQREFARDCIAELDAADTN